MSFSATALASALAAAAAVWAGWHQGLWMQPAGSGPLDMERLGALAAHTRHRVPREAGAWNVLIFGANGATGAATLSALLRDDRFASVTAVGRRAPEFAHPKLSSRVVDMDALADDGLFREADAVITAIGTTRADAGSAAAFRKVDLGYNAAVASLARMGGVPVFAHVTAFGSDANSMLLYPRTKGEAENVVWGLRFPASITARPGLLDRGDKSRFVEKLASYVLPSTPVGVLGTAIADAVVGELDRLHSTPAGASDARRDVVIEGVGKALHTRVVAGDGAPKS